MGVVGARKGVVRGGDASGAIYVNGHYPVPRRTRDAILRYINDVGRPVVASEIADELCYSQSFIQRTMRYMARDGDLKHENPGSRGHAAIFRLPGRRKNL